MCGRYALGELQFGELAELLGARPGRSGEMYEPSWNIAPTRRVPVLIGTEDERVLDLFRWGLIPSNVADLSSFRASTFNARAESVADRPTYREAFRRRRAIIPATSFFEWRKGGNSEPYAFVRGDGDLFGFAGLWEQWRHLEGETITSCTMVTCAANLDMDGIHDRMPLVLERNEWDRWLDPNLQARDELEAMIRPRQGGIIEHFLVSRDVGNVQNDRPELLEPIEVGRSGEQQLPW